MDMYHALCNSSTSAMVHTCTCSKLHCSFPLALGAGYVPWPVNLFAQECLVKETETCCIVSRGSLHDEELHVVSIKMCCPNSTFPLLM